MKPETFIDLPSKDPFGINISIAAYPLNINFNYQYYTKNVYEILSFINYNYKTIFITIIKNNINIRSVLSELIKISKHYKHRSLNLFTEYIVYNNYLSHFPRIWYNGSVYIELFSNKYIYGYVKLKYVDYNFMVNKEFEKYNSIVIY